MEHLEETLQAQILVIQKEQNKLELLKSLNLDNPITEEYFHTLCETPLRNNLYMMCKIINKIFPTATNIKWFPNYMSCEIKGFEIFIPTTKARGVEVKPDYVEEKPKKSNCLIDKDIQFLQDYINLIDTKASWYKKAQLRNNHYYKNWVLPFWWFFKICPKDRKEKRNREWFVDCLNKKLLEKQNEYEFQLNKYNEFIEKWKVYFDEVEPILKQYTPCIGEYGYSMGFLGRVANIINQEKRENHE